MTEGTKALNSAVSTLKKNPGRIGRLVKAAQFLIVPPKQYSKGKARELAEAAVAKLKAKRGLNGVVGEGAGSFSDKALQKKAEDKKGAGYAAAGGAVGAGVGRAMAREYQKDTITIRGSDRTIRQIQAGKPSSKIHAQTPVFNRRAAKTLKGAGRLGALAGVATGAVAGLGVRKVKNQMEKKAVDKKTQDRALAASAVGSGAALGGVLTHDAKKSRVTSRMGTKGAYKHMANPSVEGAEKRLANSAKTLRRMGKPLRRAGIKGAIVGGLAGAALGAAHLKKEAEARAFDPTKFKAHDFDHKPFRKTVRNSTKKVAAKGRIGKGLAVAGAALGAASYAAVKANGVRAAHLKKEAAMPAVIPKQEFLGKGNIPAGAKDVSPKAVLKRKAGKVALGVAAGAALAGVAKKHLEKKAEEESKKTSVAGLATLGAGVAGARRFVKDSNKFIKGTVQQAVHIERNGGKIGPMDVRAAMESGVRPILRRAGRATLKGAAVGALGAAALNKLRSKKDSK
ncbi:hypothetical protein DRD23_08890 [Salmonella enterica subsp. enterica serovar Enteritidis]|nr:hypothetical protein [Salmonella enterica subsp. enterica serovar Enteritidis]